MKKSLKLVDTLDSGIDEVDSREGLYRSARKFFMENGVLTDYEFNDMVLGTHMADKDIVSTEFFVDKNNKIIKHIVYLSRFGYLFKSHRKMQRKIVNIIGHIFANSKYKYELEIKLRPKN